MKPAVEQEMNRLAAMYQMKLEDVRERMRETGVAFCLDVHGDDIDIRMSTREFEGCEVLADWQIPAEVDMTAFREWQRRYLRNHKANTRIVGSWNYRDRVTDAMRATLE